MSDFDWTGKDLLGAGHRGQYGSYASLAQKAQAQADSIIKSAELFQKVKPMLNQVLTARIQSRMPIRVLQPIQFITERISKGESQSTSIITDTIPSGLDLVFDGMELGQMFFKGFRGDKEVGEYAIHTGENVVTGNQQVSRNTGLLGLLTKTDVMTEVLEYLKQK